MKVADLVPLAKRTSQRFTRRGKIAAVLVAAVAVVALFAGVAQGLAAQPVAGKASMGAAAKKMPMSAADMIKGRTTPAMRELAADRAKAKRNSLSGRIKSSLSSLFGLASVPTILDPLGVPDYFGTIPNYANSPLPDARRERERRFPAPASASSSTRCRGSAPRTANNLGQYIPVAVPDTTTYPGSRLLRDRARRVHARRCTRTCRRPSCAATCSSNTTGPQIATRPATWGPRSSPSKDRPVRIKFTNKLPTGAGGDLFIPVDTTVMGAGMGPDGGEQRTRRTAPPCTCTAAHTPWISDGTPHQWTTPAGENTPYPKGVSVQQRPRHARSRPGRADVLLHQPAERPADVLPRPCLRHHPPQRLRRRGRGLPAAGPGRADAGQRRDDPARRPSRRARSRPSRSRWSSRTRPSCRRDTQLAAAGSRRGTRRKWGGTGNLWFPHVYMPNQNPNDARRRERHGPLGLRPLVLAAVRPVNARCQPARRATPCEPTIPARRTRRIVPEAFMDTPLVNGTAYPYVEGRSRKAYRFRILNACNDRFWNLQLYYAKSNTPDVVDATGNPTLQTDAGEVPMVPAVAHPGDPTWPATWPTDGRDGGVPDPATRGSADDPDRHRGRLPAGAGRDRQPAGRLRLQPPGHRRAERHEQDALPRPGRARRRHRRLLAAFRPARSSSCTTTRPRRCPAFDPRIDYYTGDPDQTDTGGAPTTLAGYGPNTRTIMQFQVDGRHAAPAVQHWPRCRRRLPAAFAASQDPPDRAADGLRLHADRHRISTAMPDPTRR